ncbi:hypothetical protein Tco_1093341 [Tanacetum coccineum]|uniref:Peptidase A2 domain-containing protein n=1 Tax=Tanacetum coccineum TaxID=301880 RepID=A0ABQ5IEL2_9ASTR
MQSPFTQSLPKGPSQTNGEHTKIDKGKKAMSLKDVEEENIESDFGDETTHVPGSKVESFKKKELKRFNFVTEDGEHVHLNKEQISAQKKIEEAAKANVARREGEIRKEELIDLIGPIYNTRGNPGVGLHGARVVFGLRGEERKFLVKKELIVALKGELYFVKFIINPEEDDFVPESFWEIIPETIAGIEELPPFICKMGKSNHNKKRAMENFNLFYQDIGPSASAGRHLTQEEVAKEELAIRISQRYALLEEERLIIETIAYNDKYKKILDEIWKDKVGLDGKTVKEDEEAVKRIKGEALKEKEDPGAFIFPIRLEGKVNENALADTGSDINTMPYRIFETLGREDMKKVDRGITMIDHTQAEAMGKLSNVLCQVGVTAIITKFLSLDIPFDRDYNSVARFDVLRTAESDSDDEEEYVIKRNKFGAPIDGPRPASYLNYANPEDRSSAIQAVTNLFRKISVWKKAVSFLGSLPVPLKQTSGTHDGEAELSRSKRSRNETVEEFDEYGPIRIFHQEKIIKFRLGDVLTLTCWSFARQIGNKDQADELERMVSLFTFEGVYVLKACVRGRRYDQGAEDDLWLFEYVEQAFKRICKCSLGDCKMDEEKRAGHRKRSNLLCDRAIEYRQSSTLGQSIMESLTYAGVYSVPPYGAYNPPGYAQPYGVKDERRRGSMLTLRNVETEDTLYKLELEKNKAEAEAALLKAQPSFLNVGKLNELPVKSLQTKFSKILSAHDFSGSLPTKLKDLPSKFNELTEKVKGLKQQELPAEFLSVPSQVEMVQAKLKTLDALPSLLNKVTNALNQFAHGGGGGGGGGGGAIASKTTGDTSVSSAGQAGTQLAEGEKNTNQATISQLFQRKAAKNANLTKQQLKPTSPPTTPIIPPIITTTTQMQNPLQSPPKGSSQPEGEHIKKDKGKKVMSLEEAEKESANSDFDDETRVTISMVETSSIKKLKKFDFNTEDGKYIHLTKEQINQQKKIKEEAKAQAAKQEGEVRKEETV